MDIEREHIDLLIFRYLDKNASTSETAELLAWVKSMPENKEYFQRVSRQYQAAAPPMASIDVDKAWSKNMQARQIAAQSHASASRSVSIGKTAAMLPKLAVLAASVFIAAASVFVWVNYSGSTKEKEIAVSQSYSSTDTLAEFVLADSTKMTLSQHSQVSLTRRGQNTDIALWGKMYIEIPASANLYAIHTPRGPMSLGAGNYLLMSDTGAVQVSVFQGEASLADTASGRKILVRANRSLEANTGTLSQDTVRNANHLAWKTGVLVFDNTPLEEAVPQIASYYHVPMRIATKGMERCRLNAKLDRYSLEEVKTMFEIAFAAQFTADSTGITISGTPCGAE